MPSTSISRSTLSEVLGMHIKEIFGIGYHSESVSHCAHFVSHVMGYHGSAVTCANYSWDLRQTAESKGLQGATLRVDDIFKRCPEVGEWSSKEVSLTKCLAFITKKSAVNIKKRQMAPIPRKHIGIFCDNRIWHYSNTRNKVVCQTVPDFKKHYGTSEIAQKTYQLYYGKFPI